MFRRRKVRPSRELVQARREREQETTHRIHVQHRTSEIESQVKRLKELREQNHFNQALKLGWQKPKG